MHLQFGYDTPCNPSQESKQPRAGCISDVGVQKKKTTNWFCQRTKEKKKIPARKIPKPRPPRSKTLPAPAHNNTRRAITLVNNRSKFKHLERCATRCNERCVE